MKEHTAGQLMWFYVAKSHPFNQNETKLKSKDNPNLLQDSPDMLHLQAAGGIDSMPPSNDDFANVLLVTRTL